MNNFSKNRVAFVSVIIFLLSAAPFVSFAQKESKSSIKVFMIGNSTMANKHYSGGNPEKGWGQVFPLYFKNGVEFENFAVNGRSTKSFIDEGKWKNVIEKIQPGNYLIIEFGHNDEKKEDPKRFADAHTDYKTNLEKFINETRAKGGIPVLATPVNRRKFDSAGNFTDTHGDYPVVVRDIAKSMNVPLIDLHKKSEMLLKQYGPENSKRLYLWITPSEYDSLPNGRQDDTHFSAYGAFRICDLAVEELKIVLPELAKYLKD
jgi:Lysophospholipase L1 and related esterases